VHLLGVEAGGRGPGLGDNAASLTFGTPGVLQGSFTLILQDAYGQVRETHSVSAGLDYSGVGPEHAYLMTSRRVAYESATDSEALDALAECAKYEGILPAIESAHAFFGARRYAQSHPGAHILICCSGRGDKDMPILQNTNLFGPRPP
jgi:tryptophan synthase beta chain